MANLSNLNNKFLVTTGGNVLIGKTAVTGTSKLQVSGSLLVGTDINSGIPLVVQETTADGFAIGFMRNTNATNGNGLVIDVNSTAGAYIQDWRQASTVKMRLLQNGNLGIGTDNPQSKLHVKSSESGASAPWTNADNLVIEDSGNAGLAFQTPNTGAATIAFQDPESVQAGFIQYLHADNALRFATNGNNERMRIDSSGKVIINDNTIGDKLLLAGDDAGTARGLMFNCSTTTNQGDTWDIDAQSSTGIIKFSTTSTERMRIESTGVVKFPNTAASTGDVGTIAHYTNNYMYMRGGTSGLAIGDDGFGVSIYLNNSNNIAFHTGAGTEVMQIDSVGNVGIGVVPEGNIVSYIKQLRIGEQTTIQGHSDGVGGTSASWFSTNYIFSVGGATAINTGRSMVYQAQEGRHSFHNSESTTAGGVVTLRDGFSIEPNLDLKASTKGPSSGGVGAVLTPPYNLRFNNFSGTGPKFLGVYPLRGGSQFLDIAINTTSDNIMYYAMFRGYFYGRGSRWSWTAGYTYQGSIINVQNHFVLNGNAANLTAYRGAAGSAYPANLCLRMDSGSSGYTEGFGELYIFAHSNSLQNGFQVAAFSENNAANPGLWT